MSEKRGNGALRLGSSAHRGARVRIYLLAALFAAALIALMVRAAYLQIEQSAGLTALARDQYTRTVKLPGKRGQIVDRRGDVLASTIEVDSVFVTPSQLTDPRGAASALSKVLRMDERRVAALFASRKGFAWVKRHVSHPEAEAVRALNLPGIGFVKEPLRAYPQGELASQVLGVAGVDGNGLAGLELAFDEALAGRPQEVPAVRDARGRNSLLETPAPRESLEGASLTLTLDSVIQYRTEQALAVAVKNANAVGGSAVVLDPATGELLAIANYPTFNPNEPKRAPKLAMKNSAISDQIEPGSTIKVMTVAAALQEGIFGPKSLIDCEGGRWRYGGRTLHDTHAHGKLSIGEIIQVSSNIGTAKIADRLGRERLFDYTQAFGFGKKPETGLFAETGGVARIAKADIEQATRSFGQGMTASPIQIAAAYGAFANGGLRMRPYVVSKIVEADGRVVVENGPLPVRQVISPETARQVLQMMKLVVEKEGTAPMARLDYWETAGKTGTAQKADLLKGGYSADKRIASFVGVVPADAPRLVIGVWVDEPRGQVYGSVVAGPAFKEIAHAALTHLGVPHSRSMKLAAEADAKARGVKAPMAKSGSGGLERGPDGLADGELDALLGAGTVEQSALIQLPNLVGKSARLSVRTLAALGLEPNITGRGTVLQQSPGAGESVGAGSRVSLTLGSPLDGDGGGVGALKAGAGRSR